MHGRKCSFCRSVRIVRVGGGGGGGGGAPTVPALAGQLGMALVCYSSLLPLVLEPAYDVVMGAGSYV